MRCEILSVGTEILLGDVVDTNSAYLSKKLAELGISVYRHKTVGDNAKRLEAAIKEAVAENQIVIITGGLGPTQDDLTREITAKVLDLPLVEDEATVARLKELLASWGREVPKSNYKQALVPEGSIVLTNNWGTAPATITEKDETAVILLPGPPHEMEPLFEHSVLPYLSTKTGYTIKSRTIHFGDIGESRMEELVHDIIKESENPTVAPYAKSGSCYLRITARATSEVEAAKKIAPVEEEITKRLAEHIYGYDGESYQEKLVSLLREKKMTLATAESCTGGLISSFIVDEPGASEVFVGGVIAYSNQVKVEQLGVSSECLDRHGAVSEETVREMARGASNRFGTDCAISVSGVAGPGGGTAEKPVGLVYGAVKIKDKIIVKRMELGTKRSRIRHRSAVTMLFTLIKELEKSSY